MNPVEVGHYANTKCRPNSHKQGRLLFETLDDYARKEFGWCCCTLVNSHT
jgi:hypothetical protein